MRYSSQHNAPKLYPQFYQLLRDRAGGAGMCCIHNRLEQAWPIGHSRTEIRISTGGDIRLSNRRCNINQPDREHAIDTAQRLSHQLRAAEDRIAELKAEVEAYRQ